MKTIEQSYLTYSKNHNPACTCNPGDVVAFQSMDAFSNKVISENQLISTIPGSASNPAAGPLYVNGAMPGDVLEVEILDIEVAETGVVATCRDWGPLADKMEERTMILPIKDGKITFKGMVFNANPMVGTIGTTPADEDVFCFYPGKHGGNMDCKQIKVGTKVYLPVFVEGGMLQIGDLHAAMGDGELCGAGLEVAGTTTVKVDIIKGIHINWPLIETEDKCYVNTCAPEYADALVLACEEMQMHLMNNYGWDETEAYLYLSIQGDAEINQACKNPEGCDVTVRVGIPKNNGRLI